MGVLRRHSADHYRIHVENVQVRGNHGVKVDIFAIGWMRMKYRQHLPFSAGIKKIMYDSVSSMHR